MVMTDEEKKAEDIRRMESARAEAADVLATLPVEVVAPIAKWAGEWYGDASYKGIGRVLVAYAKEHGMV